MVVISDFQHHGKWKTMLSLVDKWTLIENKLTTIVIPPGWSRLVRQLRRFCVGMKVHLVPKAEIVNSTYFQN